MAVMVTEIGSNSRGILNAAPTMIMMNLHGRAVYPIGGPEEILGA